MTKYDLGIVALVIGHVAGVAAFALIFTAIFLSRSKYCGRFDGVSGFMGVGAFILAMISGLTLRGGFDLIKE